MWIISEFLQKECQLIFFSFLHVCWKGNVNVSLPYSKQIFNCKSWIQWFSTAENPGKYTANKNLTAVKNYTHTYQLQIQCLIPEYCWKTLCRWISAAAYYIVQCQCHFIQLKCWTMSSLSFSPQENLSN